VVVVVVVVAVVGMVLMRGAGIEIEIDVIWYAIYAYVLINMTTRKVCRGKRRREKVALGGDTGF
jgi:hypothetical protein